MPGKVLTLWRLLHMLRHFDPPFFRPLENLYSFDPYTREKKHRKMSHFDPYFLSKFGGMYCFDPSLWPFVALRVNMRCWAPLSEKFIRHFFQYNYSRLILEVIRQYVWWFWSDILQIHLPTHRMGHLNMDGWNVRWSNSFSWTLRCILFKICLQRWSEREHEILVQALEADRGRNLLEGTLTPTVTAEQRQRAWSELAEKLSKWNCCWISLYVIGPLQMHNHWLALDARLVNFLLSNGNRLVSQMRAPLGGLSQTSWKLWQDYSSY